MSTSTEPADLPEQFIHERVYLKSVTPRTVKWYRQAFHAFDGAMHSREAIIQRIAEQRKRGVSAVRGE